MQEAVPQASQQVQSDKLLFSEALKRIISDLGERSQEIIFSRYGVFSPSSMTLEEIGKKYQITRERVRQVIREVLKKVREKKNHPLFAQVKDAVVLAVTENGGIIEEQKLLSVLGKNNSSEQASVRFFLECIDEIKSQETKGELAFSYSLPDFDLTLWRSVMDSALEILKKQKRPLASEELFKLLQGENKNLGIDEKTFANFLEVSEEIKKNNFDKWGVAKWKEISPKGTREKAYLVLKESEEPMHFRDIAKKIDKYHLNKKKTHPQTVHNELIKDSNFVLVGRGIYALAEWGYKKGTVKDVIEEILVKNTKPLSREEILTKVLEIRHVKKSTIVINLNNYFAKSKEGTYSIKK